jgi:LemA protein
MIAITLWSNLFSAVSVLLGLLALITLWWISAMNRLRQAQLRVQEAESGIDLALTKRYEGLSRFLETVRGVAPQEAETLGSIVRWRTGVPPHATISDKEAFLSQLETIASGINNLVEQHFALKSVASFDELQQAEIHARDQFQVARRFYNANAASLNSLIVSFPTSLVANGLRVEKRPLFETEPEKNADEDIRY